MKRYFPLIFFIISFFIHLFYYYSAFFGHSLDLFFENVTPGQDFFQIPNAAYSFINGGSLQGNLPKNISPYIICCGVNSNVYHPFFTLLIGIPLQFFSPWTSFSLWVVLHLIFSLMLIYYFWINYKNNSHLFTALSLYLLNSYHYYEIKHAQYHFLLTFFTVILLSELVKNKNNIITGFLYFLSLIVKPLGLLWLIPLFFFKKYKTLFVGIGIFLAVSIPFLISPIGNYYFHNILTTSSSSFSNYNLMALTHFTNISQEQFRIITIISALLLIILQILKRPHIFYVFFLWIGFQLIFFSLSFHYHYIILSGLFALGIVLNLFSIKKIEAIPIIVLTLPSPVIIFRFMGDPPILPEKHLALVALWSVFWLTCLMIIVIYKVWAQKKYVSS